jgi:dUTPase
MIRVEAGVIDMDYRGEVKVLLFNHRQQSFLVKDDNRIAQLILEEIKNTEAEEVLTCTFASNIILIWWRFKLVTHLILSEKNGEKKEANDNGHSFLSFEGYYWLLPLLVSHHSRAPELGLIQEHLASNSVCSDLRSSLVERTLASKRQYPTHQNDQTKNFLFAFYQFWWIPLSFFCPCLNLLGEQIDHLQPTLNIPSRLSVIPTTTKTSRQRPAD